MLEILLDERPRPSCAEILKKAFLNSWEKVWEHHVKIEIKRRLNLTIKISAYSKIYFATQFSGRIGIGE
jgi:hypothetical protein